MDTMTTVTCGYCGVAFERIAAEANYGRARGRLNYCSRSHAKLDHPSVNHETTMTLAERAWAKVERGDGCWLWRGALNSHGYGKMYTRTGDKHWHQPHRVIWEDVHGPIPPGLFVCHHCDNPPCVRPDHMFLGTAADNMADMWAKGRHPNAKSRVMG